MSKTIWLGRQSPAQEASFDRWMPEMLALLQSGEHPGSQQKAELAAGLVQYAILDLKEAEFGWQNELVTTKKCDFP